MKNESNIEYMYKLPHKSSLYIIHLLLMTVIIMEPGCPTHCMAYQLLSLSASKLYTPDKSLSHTAPYCALFVPLIFPLLVRFVPGS